MYFSKDVRLPVQLQRAMAAEAEATREARAKVCNILLFFMVSQPNINSSVSQFLIYTEAFQGYILWALELL